MSKEKISIGSSTKKYEIEEISQNQPHVLKIVFAGDIPKNFGDIEVFTAGDIQCANLPGYGTIWKKDNKTVWLSDDGSVYTEPKKDTSEVPKEK